MTKKKTGKSKAVKNGKAAKAATNGKKAAPTYDELKVKQVKENFKAFQKVVPELVKKYPFWYAIMRDKKVVAICKNMDAGRPYAEKRFPDGLYSVQLITDKPIRIPNGPLTR